MIPQLLTHYGLLAIGGLILFESAGLPVPGETALLLGAAAAAQHLLPFWAVILVAVLAAILGDSMGYWVGLRYGLPLLQRYGAWLHISPAQLTAAQTSMQRHGPKVVFFGRFVALLRVLSAFLAGVGQMPYGQFLRYNAFGGIVWTCLIGGIGYLFGQQLPQLERLLHQAGWAATSMVVVVLVATIIGGRGWLHRRATRLYEGS
jgi:membrane protein DedA with SNARE-associated domain